MASQNRCVRFSEKKQKNWGKEFSGNPPRRYCHVAMSQYKWSMATDTYTLNDLAEATGIEARTIRSYIERGLLPAADARGRGATYSAEHFLRLRAIQVLRGARPNIQLNEIRIFLQQMSPQQLSDFCSGLLKATAAALAAKIDDAENPEALQAVGQFLQADPDDALDSVSAPEDKTERAPEELTGPERLLQALRKIARPTPATLPSKVDAWVRLPVTNAFEVAVRAEFASGQMSVFRELANVLRMLLLRTDSLIPTDDE
jgi:DNA-binding transcriptional MerR regulator